MVGALFMGPTQRLTQKALMVYELSMRNYRTTIGGIMLSIGTMMIPVMEPGWVSAVGTSLVAVGGLVMGVQAKDRK